MEKFSIFNKLAYFSNTFILFSYRPIFFIALNFADLDGGFNFNSRELGVTDFFVIRLNDFFLVFFSGKYLETLSCFERWLKKNLQILSSNE